MKEDPFPRARAWPPKRVAVFYPWGDFGTGYSGASRRVTNVIDFLCDKVPEIRVLQRCGEPTATYRGIPVESHNFRRRELFDLVRHAVHLLLFAGLALVTLGRSRGQEDLLWAHIWPRFHPRFAHRVIELVRWADAVLLEYTFWGSLVMPVARQLGVKVILTSHDVVSAQMTRSALLRRLTERVERKMLTMADECVMVSPRDEEFWRTKGIKSTTIRHGIDMRRFEGAMPFAPEVIVREFCDPSFAAALNPPILLFVGVAFPPNYSAVRHLRHIAAMMTTDGGTTPTIVVAGSCAAPECSGNFVALGRVDDILLSALHRMAAIILAPVPFGTGSSVKTIEALAAGRPVLGTSAAFRGWDVTDRVNCLIEDDIAAYPARIRELLDDPQLSARLGAAAASFARAYDFRTVYRAYLPLLGLSDSASTTAAVDEVDRAGWMSLVRQAVGRSKPELALKILHWLLERYRDDPELLAEAANIASFMPDSGAATAVANPQPI
jgi:glycosyltransferase involved in cell wall biosynthesis